MAQMVKNLPARQETLVRYLGWDDLLEKGMATHSSTVARRILRIFLVGYSPWGCKESDTERMLTCKQVGFTKSQ